MIDIGHETWQIFFFLIFKRSILCMYKHLVKYSFDIQINKKKKMYLLKLMLRGTHTIKMFYSSQYLVILKKN